MATIAKLNTVVSGDSSGFNKAMDDVQKRASSSISAVSTTLTGLVAVGKNLFKLLAPAVAVFAAIGAVNAAVDTYKFARSVGVASSEVEALRIAVKGVGADASVADSIIAHLASNIATLGKGNVIFADTLQRIGVDAKQLSTLPPPRALEVIVAALSNIRDNTQRAAAAYQIFGNDAAAILSIVAAMDGVQNSAQRTDETFGRLGNNAAAAMDGVQNSAQRADASFDRLGNKITEGTNLLKDAAAMARGFGVATEDVRLAQIEDAQKKWERFGDLIHGIGLRIASELIPYVTAIITLLPDIGTVAKVVEVHVMTTLDAISFLSTGFVQLIAAAKFAKASIAVVFLGITRIVTDQLASWAIKLMGFLQFVGISIPQVLMQIGMFDETVAKNLQSAMNDATAAATEFVTANVDVAAALRSIKDEADAAGSAMDKINKANGAVAAANNMAGLFQKGLEVTKEFQSPLQKFNTRMEELNALIEVGAISWDTYSKATHDAVNQLEKAHELQRMGLSAATQAGTVEAYSSILTSQQQDNMSLRETPMERTNRILQDSKEIEKKIAENTQKTAEAIQSITVVKI